MQRRVSERTVRLGKSGLAFFFEPNNVAVIGSMREGLFCGHAAIKNLLKSGFKGKIYPIDPSCSEVFGLKVHTAIKNVSGKIDLVLIITDYRAVPTVMMECAEKDVKAVIIASDGVAEGNEEELMLQKKIVKIATQSGMRIIGPNTAGIINTGNGLICCPYIMGYEKIRSGGIALCAQTTMIGPHAFPYADFHYGVSKLCDLGNKWDVDESDMLEYLENDPSTKIISMHLENMREGRRFLEIAKRVTYRKPVLVLKSGRTNEVGILSTHRNDSRSVDDHIFGAFCKQEGIIRLEKFAELFEVPKIFAYQPLPKGNKLGIVSHTGMAAVLATDEGAKYNLSVAKLSPETVTKLNLIFPNLWKTFVDIGPLASSRSNYVSIYPEILKTILADDNLDCLLHILWLNPGIASIEDYINIYRELKNSCQKPVAIWVYGPRLPIIYDVACHLEDLGFPVFSELEIAIKAIGVAYQYAIWKKKRHEREAINSP